MTFHQIRKGVIGRSAAAAFFVLLLPSVSVAEEDDDAAAAEPKGSSGVSIGTDPSQAKVVGAGSADGAPPLTIRTSTQNWEFGFHGYLRAPLRMSFDKYDVETYPTDENGVPITSEDPSTSKDWRFNMSPALPDSTYTAWNYTHSLGGPWAEMFFSYGNSIAVGTVSIATYNITDSSWRNLQSQLGIDQAFVTLNFPRAFGSLGGLTWNVGVFANRYGSAGRYDAGRYDTYIIGRTHIAGETLTAKLDLLDNLVLVLEHGFGAKSDVLDGNAKGFLDQSGDHSTDLGWVPYSGEEGQWPAMVHHAHAGLVFHTNKLFKELMINGHFMHAFTNSADPSNNSITWPYKEKDAKMLIGGVELKANGAIFGDAYIGFSSMKTDGLNKMSDAIELLHSQGGWCLLKNFYGDQTLSDNTATDASSSTTRDGKGNPGTGVINTLAWQYQFSLSRLLWFLQDKEFWGQGPDLTLSAWGMVNFVNPDDDLEPYLKRWAKRKVKYGFEAMYTPVKYFGFGVRMDRVIPDTEYDINDVDTNLAASKTSYAPFTVISPKLQFKTAFITHEEVNIQFSHYFWKKGNLSDREYRNQVRAEDPNEGEQADRNALMISVNMWW